MLQRFGEVSANIADLLEAKSRLLARDAERAGVRLGVSIFAGCLGVLGLVALFGAITIVIAEAIGTAGALALAGVAATALGVGVLAATRWAEGRSGRRSRAELEREAAEHLERLIDPGDDDEASPIAGIASDIVGAITRHPNIAAGAAFAVLAVFGPRRVCRAASEAAAAVNVAASVSGLLRELYPDDTDTDEEESVGRSHRSENGIAANGRHRRSGRTMSRH
jgi:hypothetical protein